MLREVFNTRTLVLGALAGGLMERDHKLAISVPKSSLDAYLGLTLPYQFKKTKITPKIDATDFKHIKATLDKKNEILNGPK